MTIQDQARESLGRVGVWLGSTATQPFAVERDAVKRIEDLGYRSLWVPESTKEAMAHAAVLLAATDSITIATGIANIWARDAVAAESGSRILGDAYPGRFVLGLGVSHAPSVQGRGHTYAGPLSMMRAYLEEMASSERVGPAPTTQVPKLIGALRGKMLALSASHTAGAHPYNTTVEHTVFAREQLGAEPVLAPEVGVVLSTDADVARAAARRFLMPYLGLPNYTNNLRDYGFGDEDFTDGGSDGLVDALIPWGDEEAIAERIAEHLNAGADHVCVQSISPDGGLGVDELARLAPQLLAL